MKLIITKHGVTVENEQGIMQGQLPGKLSKTGKKQAKEIALRLKDEKIDFIYSSDLARTADTTKEIIKFHPKAPVFYTKEVRERHAGEFQGRKKSDFGWDKWVKELPQPKEGESRQEIYDRAENFYHRILKKHLNDSVLVVAHDFFNRNLIGVIMKKTPDEVRELEIQKAPSVTIFEIDKDKNHELNVMNCTKHLN